MEHAGRADDLAVFEDAVLALLPTYGGQLLTRDLVIDRREGDPLEVQVIELPDEVALSGYMEDPRRSDLAHTHDREALIARTQVLSVQRRVPH